VSGACALERAGLGVAADAAAPDLADLDLGAEDAARDADADEGDLGTNLGVDLGVDAGPRCDPDACAGRRCVDGACGHHASCRQLHEARADLESGLYEVDVDGAGGEAAPVRVWCDMDLDSGGWTLVGRTAGSRDGGPFGWTSPRGAVDDDGAPYALGLGSALGFSEILVGRRGPGKTWGGNVYRVTVGANFLELHRTLAQVFPVTVVRGGCTPDGGPAMLRFWGHTSATDHFFFRDSATLDLYGMRPHEFSVNYGDCTNGGDLHRTEGMIMVR
jgi:hypothetical protein